MVAKIFSKGLSTISAIAATRFVDCLDDTGVRKAQEAAKRVPDSVKKLGG